MILLTTSHALFKVILKIAERAVKSSKSLTFRVDLFSNFLFIAVSSCLITLSSFGRFNSLALSGKFKEAICNNYSKVVIILHTKS